MTKLYISIILVLSILLTLISIKSCITVPSTVVLIDTVTEIRFTPPQNIVSKAQIQYTPKYIHDTIIRDGQKIAITPEKYCLENLEFTAKSDTLLTSKGDTANIVFHYPAMIFDLSMKFKADSQITVTNTITKLIKPSPFGVFVGGGMYVAPNGNIRFGVGLNVGIRIL